MKNGQIEARANIAGFEKQQAEYFRFESLPKTSVGMYANKVFFDTMCMAISAAFPAKMAVQDPPSIHHYFAFIHTS